MQKSKSGIRVVLGDTAQVVATFSAAVALTALVLVNSNLGAGWKIACWVAAAAALFGGVSGLLRRRTARKIARREKVLESVTRALVATSLNRAAMAQVIFEHVGPYLNADMFFNFEVRDDALHLVNAFGVPIEKWQVCQRLEIGQAFCGTVAETLTPLFAPCSQVDTDPRGSLVKSMGARTYMCHPLLSKGGTLLGTVSFGSRFRKSFDEDDTELLETVSHFLSLAWERLAAEQQRTQMETQLRQSQKMESLGTLAGGIAHDFNNVLFAMLGNAELIGTSFGPDHPDRPLFDEIRKAGQRARELIQRILAFSKPSVELRTTTCLEDVADEVISLLKSTLPASVELVRQPSTQPPSVSADQAQVHQVLLNLATNSWHAMGGKPGRIEFAVNGCRVDTTLSTRYPDLHPGPYAILSVRDNGKGMDAATVSRIFEPFFTTKPPGVGTGLGLSVVHGIMRAHEGAIIVDSTPGKGTTFNLYFPATPVATADEPAFGDDDESTAVTVATGHGEHVVYIDDDPSLVILGSRMLGRRGYRFSGYTNAAEALELLESRQLTPDLVITDYNMPGLSGLDVARRIAALDRSIPVVLMSGFLSDELQLWAREAGITHLLHKPDSVEGLLRIIPLALNGRVAVR